MRKTHLFARLAAASALLLLSACTALSEGSGSPARPESTAADLTGKWRGTLNLEGQELTIVVRFEPAEPLTGSIDIPQQGARELPLVNIRLISGTVYFELSAGDGSALFCGELERDLIRGTFTQSGIRGSFTLARGGMHPPAAEDSPPPAIPPP